jgi:hypothetical protein
MEPFTVGRSPMARVNSVASPVAFSILAPFSGVSLRFVRPGCRV